MEFGIRELVQFGTLLASLAGAFAVVKSQLSRVIQDIAQIEKVLTEMNTRIDQADADRAVIKHQNKVFSTILSPGKLEAQHRELASIKASLDSIVSEVSTLRHMHNGKHPNVN